jgi:hypothetical protein
MIQSTSEFKTQRFVTALAVSMVGIGAVEAFAQKNGALHELGWLSKMP